MPSLNGAEGLEEVVHAQYPGTAWEHSGGGWRGSGGTWRCLLTAASIGILIMADMLAEAYLFAVVQGVPSGGRNTLAHIMWASSCGRETLGSIHGLSRASQAPASPSGPWYWA